MDLTQLACFAQVRQKALRAADSRSRLAEATLTLVLFEAVRVVESADEAKHWMHNAQQDPRWLICAVFQLNLDRRVTNRLHVEAVNRAQEVYLPLHALLVFKVTIAVAAARASTSTVRTLLPAIARAIRIASS